VADTPISSSQHSVKQPLSDEETRAILTPFAFKIDQSLFGIPLAKPWRRGIAILIDLLIITILSDAPGELLAVVIAITLYRLGNKKRAQKLGEIKGKKRRAIFRGIGAFILCIILLDVLPQIFDTFTKKTDQSQSQTGVKNHNDDLNLENIFENNPDALALVSKIFIDAATSDCESVQCWKKTFNKIPSLLITLPRSTINKDELYKIVNDIVDITSLKKQERQQLTEYLIDQYNKQLALQPPKNETNKVSSSEKGLLTVKSDQTSQTPKSEPIYSIVKLVQGIIEDLGLGFGWAAFYFTVLTALWHGQTIGKKALGIRVLQLDGTPLTLFDSFERYGGYGAGIATGMLGFLQIYWDPNRQAIHDRISSTVVIDIEETNKNKI